LPAFAPVIQSNPIQSNPIVAVDINCYQKYGEFQNVLLTQIEYDKLLLKIGEAHTKEQITSLSEYMKSHGKRYKSHYATILTWQRNDDKKRVNQSVNKTQPIKNYKSIKELPE
jgi:hypothetical protein